MNLKTGGVITKIIITLSIITAGLDAGQAQRRYSDYVNPFIGVDSWGEVFVGATLPYGMVKLGPDCGDRRSNSGYDNGPVWGFSHVHASGTGGGPKYGNVLVMPLTGEIDFKNWSSERKDEKAVPGYFSVFLSRYNTKAEMTISQSVGFHKYTFPSSAKSSVIIDAASCLGMRKGGEGQSLVGSEITILNDSVVQGYTRIRGGWNKGGAYTVYFYGVFNKNADSCGTWKLSTVGKNRSQYDTGDNTGAYFTFNTTDGKPLLLKVGISFLGTGKARFNLEKEMAGWDFEAACKAANDNWEKSLGVIDVQGGDDDKVSFYTGLYHSMLMPTCRSGENPNWRSDEPHYDDFYAIWDTFRSLHPLLTLIAADRQIEMIRSLIDIAENDGYMPDSRSGNDNGRTQGGSNCDIVIADAFVKGLQGVDYEKAYKAMIKNAEIPPGGDERKEGRGGISDYNTVGFVSSTYERAGTRTVEYANCDWAIAQVARGLGKMDDYATYKARANNWMNLWRPIEDHGAKGFISPRNKDKTWVEEISTFNREKRQNEKTPFNPFIGGSWKDFFYESHSWEYSLYVPHDVKKLIELCGGKEKFISRLDTFFINGYYQVSNEPGFLAPVLYNWAGRPDRTAETVRATIRKYYNSSRKGLPGNDDSGAMSSWFVFHSMGFYPNAGQDIYLIGSPLFTRTVMHLSNGKIFEIVAKNCNEKNMYIQSVKLNGKDWNQCWFRHGDIINGAQLELVMGPSASKWGRQLPPPSMSDEK